MKRAKGAKGKADALFSQLIRSHGECERCGKRPPEVQLQTSHWISRSYAQVRVDPDNAFCLCAGCHRWWHQWPTESSEWAISMRGRDTYERLREAALSGSRVKVDWDEQVQILKGLV